MHASEYIPSLGYGLLFKPAFEPGWTVNGWKYENTECAPSLELMCSVCCSHGKRVFSKYHGDFPRSHSCQSLSHPSPQPNRPRVRTHHPVLTRPFSNGHFPFSSRSPALDSVTRQLTPAPRREGLVQGSASVPWKHIMGAQLFLNGSSRWTHGVKPN